MKSIALTLLLALSGLAFEVKLYNQDGSPFANEGGVVQVEKKETVRPDGSRMYRCKVTSNTDDKLFLRIAANSDEFAGKDLSVYNGCEEKKFTAEKVGNPLLKNDAFLLGALFDGKRGIALALGAEDMNSFADFAGWKTKNGAAMRVSVNAAFLRKGQFYSCTFHQFDFSPKYGIRDAYAHYYKYYPKRFKRDETVNPRIFGICAEYCSWIANNPERCRLCNASWEWCHAAERSWGDPCNLEKPVNNDKDFVWVDPIRYSDRAGRSIDKKGSRLSQEEFDAVQQERLGYGYRCGVANGFYMMALAVISKQIAARYPDSLPTHHHYPSDYIRGADIFVFPEVGWGQKLQEHFALLAQKYDVGCLAFDVSDPHSVYRGEALARMNNVGFDQYGEGVCRGIGSAKLFEYIRTLPCKNWPYKQGVAINTYYTQITDMLYADNTMVERAPWDKEPPFPLEYRFALGEKALQLWEGYSLGSLDPNYKTWTAQEQATVINDLAHYAVHSSFRCGASLPYYYLNEYVSKVAHAFTACNDAGWKPVFGANEPKDTQLARYGLGENALFSVNNLLPEDREIRMRIYPAELRSGYVRSKASRQPILFASYFGGKCLNVLEGERDYLKFSVPGQLVNVLEAVGTASGEGELAVSWGGDFSEIQLNLVSGTFAGTVVPRVSFGTYKLVGEPHLAMKSGDKAQLRYRNSAISGNLADSQVLCPAAGGKVTVLYARGQESRDIAERFQCFFAAACQAKVELRLDETLPEFTVLLGKVTEALEPGITANAQTLAVHAVDRCAFDELAKRMLNGMNARIYPDYIPSPRMKPEDAKFFSFQRY